jgi:hypothetical protein
MIDDSPTDGNDPKFSVDDLVLKMNGIAPRAVSNPSQPESAPSTGATDPSSSTTAEHTDTSQSRPSNVIRVTEVSRALSMAIAQRDEDRRLALRLASDRPLRAVRAASVVQRKQHQQSQAEQSSVRSRPSTRMAGSLDVLKSCVVYVDITTEENEDASGLFVDMLRGLGARVSEKADCLLIGLLKQLDRYFRNRVECALIWFSRTAARTRSFSGGKGT